jgi:hypothetical protein
MADELAAILSDPNLIARLLLEKQRRLARPEVGAGEHGLPSMPDTGVSPREMRSPNSEVIDAFLEATGLPLSVGQTNALDAVYSQGEKGPRALADFLAGPSIPNATNLGVELGTTAMRPAAVLGSVGAGYGAAALKDLGAFDMEAQAQQKLNRKQRQELEIERQREERASRLRREEADAEAKRKLETSQKTAGQEEYNRAVERSEAAYKREMDRDWRFDESNVGQVWRGTGGLGPALVGFGLGKLSRAATGPGETTLGKVVKDYVAPTTAGAVGGGISANLPLVGEALYAPAYNPKKAAYEARAEELPSNHPRRNEYIEYAKSLPEKNPVRTNASDEFYDTAKLKERMGIGALEGASGGLAASDLINALARLGRGAGERLGVIASRQQSTPPGGTVIDAVPLARVEAAAEPSMAKMLSEMRGLPPPAAAASNQGSSRVLDKMKAGKEAVPEPATPPIPEAANLNPPPPKGKVWDMNGKGSKLKDKKTNRYEPMPDND